MQPLRLSPIALFLRVLGIVFVVEAGVMLILPSVLPAQVPDMIHALVDSLLLNLISAPLLWWTVVLPLRRTAVTEHARAEAIQAATPQGVITFDERGVVQSANQAAGEIFGYSVDEIQACDLADLFPWQFLTRQREDPQSTGPRRPAPGTVKVVGLHKDGREVPLAMSVTEVRSDESPLYTVVMRGLEDREREALRAEQMAAVAQMGTAFAHRLRNPLTSIKMLVQASKRPAGPLTLDREDLRIIEEEIRRMERAVAMFLEFARPSPLCLQRLNLGELASESAAALQSQAQRKQVTLRADISAVRSTVRGDRGQLRQLIDHLLQNAIDATPAGGAVDLTLAEVDGEKVELRVVDSGAGIPPDLLARLFQPFVTTKSTGVGLGLANCGRIAEAHRAVISAANRPQGGACFVVRLPADVPED